MVTYAAPRTDAAGSWLCTTVPDCDGGATLQGAYACDGCENVIAALAVQLDGLAAEREQHARALELIQAELARRADAGEDGRLSAVEEVAVRLGMDRVKQLGEDIARLAAAHAAVLAEHTHPVFACAKHENRLPKPAG